MERQEGREKEGLLPPGLLPNGGALIREQEGSLLPAPGSVGGSPRPAAGGWGAGQALAKGSEPPPLAQPETGPWLTQ